MLAQHHCGSGHGLGIDVNRDDMSGPKAYSRNGGHPGPTSQIQKGLIGQRALAYQRANAFWASLSLSSSIVSA
jgi:hypothetical protein